MKIILKLEKICEGVCLKEKGNKFIKNGILATLNLKERQKINDLKLFENWNRIKTIWKKTRVLKIEILKIKFKNWNFGKLFENGSFEH